MSKVLDFLFGWMKPKKEVVASQPKKEVSLEQILRDDLLELLLVDVGERETKGKNRSPFIDAINKDVRDAYLGAPYCLSWIVSRGIKRLCAKHGYKMPSWMNTPSTQSFYNAAPAKYKIPKGSLPKKGDVGIQQSKTNSGSGHAYILVKDQVSSTQETVEANTDASGGRDGDGVYRRTRTQNGDSSKNYRGAVNVIQAIIDHNKKA